MEYTDIDSVIDDSNVKDVIEHPQKVYITRVNARSGSITYTESQNEEFSDIAVAARKDTKGAVITYVKKDIPPVTVDRIGRLRSASMAIPSNVLINDTLSAPLSSAARAISVISVTFGESFTISVFL